MSKSIRVFFLLILINGLSFAKGQVKTVERFAVNNSQATFTEKKAAGIKKNELVNKVISLNFQDIKVRSALQILAEFTGMNIVVSDKVAGSLSLHLKEIPWEQALNIILTTQALGKRKIGQVILIAPVEEIAEYEKKELYAEQLVAELSPLHSDLLQINYARAADIAVMLKDKNAAFLSERGRLSADIRTNTIWVQDSSTRLKEIVRLVRQLDVPVKQVLIEARLVNVTKDFARDLGIRFGLSTTTNVSGTLKGAGQLVQNQVQAGLIPLADRLNVDLAAAPLAASPASLGIALAKLSDRILLDLELSALESEGRGEIISSPRLLTTNQQAAVIEAGEEIPYQEATSSGATAVTFKKAVLSLKVTPRITSDKKIQMDLQINQDTLSSRVFNEIPAILTKEIQTNILINDGQTIVLGGIYKQNKDNIVNRVPFLGELPVVGALFRNKVSAIRNEELLIFITPRIITSNLPRKAEGHRQGFVKGVELDKFGKPVGLPH